MGIIFDDEVFQFLRAEYFISQNIYKKKISL